MTNYDRFMKCTPEQLTSVFYNLKENAIYANGRLLNIEDNEKDFLLWLNKESDDLDSEIFDMRMKKVTLDYYTLSDNKTIDIYIPFWYGDEEIISLFKEKLNVEYSPDKCSIIYWN